MTTDIIQFQINQLQQDTPMMRDKLRDKRTLSKLSYPHFEQSHFIFPASLTGMSHQELLAKRPS
jgi:hypothetical protein